MGKKPTLEQRKALGSFLASRRARLRPGDVNLPTGRRRTSGLRREEVAVLAGVSVSWYTWLEQGRDVRASAETLERVANVLRLDRAEAAHLFALSSRERPAAATSMVLSDRLLELVEAIDPVPAYVRTPWLDIIAWNAAVADLFIDYGSLEPRERNTLRLLFTEPSYRMLVVDWEAMTRGMLSTFRAARARAADKAPFDRIVDELSGASGEFRDWWPDVDVAAFDEGTKRLRHPTMGTIDLTYIALASEAQPDLSIVVYMPRRRPGDAQ